MLINEGQELGRGPEEGFYRSKDGLTRFDELNGDMLSEVGRCHWHAWVWPQLEGLQTGVAQHETGRQARESLVFSLFEPG